MLKLLVHSIPSVLFWLSCNPPMPILILIFRQMYRVVRSSASALCTPVHKKLSANNINISIILTTAGQEIKFPIHSHYLITQCYLCLLSAISYIDCDGNAEKLIYSVLPKFGSKNLVELRNFGRI